MPDDKATALALVPDSRTPQGLVPRTLTEMMDMSKLLAQSTIVPKHFQGSPANVFVALEFGAELGLAPMSALRNVYIIEGRPSLSAQAIHAVCISAPDCDWFRRNDDLSERGKVEVWEAKRRGVVHRGSFSLDDARSANLLGKDNWKHYPADMLENRAIARCGRRAFPDRIGGIHTSDELRDGVIEMEETIANTFAPPPKPEDRRKTLTPEAIEHAQAETERTGFAQAASTVEEMLVTDLDPDRGDEVARLHYELDEFLAKPESLTEQARVNLHQRALSLPKGFDRTAIAAKYSKLVKAFEALKQVGGR